MPLHVGFGQFDSHGETLHDQDDARAFERYLVDVSPRVRVEQVGGIRAEYDTAECGYCSFADVKLLLHKERAQHKQTGKATQDDIRPVSLVRR